jgi:lysyl-tRNA synthetase, class I
MTETKSMFWADQIAERMVNERGKKKLIIFSGTTPSGTVHAGNFRDTITMYTVFLALKSRGVDVEHFQSWDDFDRFRKVPGNVPKDWEKYIGLPVSGVPDPWGCCKSYAEHFEKQYIAELKVVGVDCKHVYQTKMYTGLKYKELIKISMLNREKIIEILNKVRTKPLEKDWQPVRIYCKKCGKDSTKLLNYDDGYVIDYSCECGFKGKIDFSKEGNMKVAYRVDWPMKWHYNSTDYEAGGKDLFTAGSVLWTGRDIQKVVFGSEPPINTAYNQVMIKGEGVKMSGSKGNALTLSDLLKLFIPELIRFIYVGTKPNKEFTLSFDEDVFKTYEDFYFAERVYFGNEDVNEKDQQQWSRIYELSQINTIPKKMPDQPKFSHCVELINLCNHDVKKSLDRAKELNEVKDEKRWLAILERAKFWVENYADDKYKFDVRDKINFELSDEEKVVVDGLVNIINKGLDEEELGCEIYKFVKESELGTKKSFKLIYRILANKEKGPRLAPFIIAIGQKRVKKILESI